MRLKIFFKYLDLKKDDSQNGYAKQVVWGEQLFAGRRMHRCGSLNFIFCACLEIFFLPKFLKMHFIINRKLANKSHLTPWKFKQVKHTARHGSARVQSFLFRRLRQEDGKFQPCLGYSEFKVRLGNLVRHCFKVIEVLEGVEHEGDQAPN